MTRAVGAAGFAGVAAGAASAAGGVAAARVMEESVGSANAGPEMVLEKMPIAATTAQPAMRPRAAPTILNMEVLRWWLCPPSLGRTPVYGRDNVNVKTADGWRRDPRQPGCSPHSLRNYDP